MIFCGKISTQFNPPVFHIIFDKKCVVCGNIKGGDLELNY